MNRLLIFFLFACSVFGQSPVTVTGTVTDAGNNLATSGYVQFDVQPRSGSIQYYIPNVTTINPTTQCGISILGQVLNLALSGPCLVWGNDNISPGNTNYRVTFAPNGVVTSIVQNELITGSSYSLNLPQFRPLIQLTPQQNTIITNPFQTNILPSAASTFNIGSPTLQYGAIYTNQLFLNGALFSTANLPRLNANNAFTGNNTHSGTESYSGLLAPANLANSVWVCSTSVVFLYQTLAAGYAALPSSGGTVEVCSGHTETLAANLVMSKSNSGFHFNGPALITQGSFQITAAGGIDGLFIAGPWPMDPLQGYQGVEFSYSGTSDAMAFGNSSTHSFGLRLENFQVSLFSASGSAQAIHIIGTTSYDIRNVGGGTAIGSNSMNGLVLDGGTGTLFTGDGIVYNWASENFCSAIIFTGTSGHGANNNTVIGGKSVGSTQAGCATLNFLDGDLNTVVGFDMEGSPIGTSFANVADVFGNSVEVENEGNTTDVSFGAASSYNRFVARNLSPVVAGAGAPPTNSNSVVWYDSFAQDASGNFYLNGTLKKVNGVATAGNGVSSIHAATSQKAETGSADTNVLTFTPPANAGTYRTCFTASVSSATAGVVSWTLSWTDSNGNAQTNIAQDLFQDGTAAPALSFTTSAAGNYHFCRELDVNNAAASIIVKWVGGGTTAAKVSASVERVI